jgi:hypothetical protein
MGDAGVSDSVGSRLQRSIALVHTPLSVGGSYPCVETLSEPVWVEKQLDLPVVNLSRTVAAPRIDCGRVLLSLKGVVPRRDEIGKPRRGVGHSSTLGGHGGYDYIPAYRLKPMTPI